jgi:drug/metabolite transporter (DMT)-like permease
MDLFGVIAGIAAASIWGGMYVVSKAVLDIIPPFVLLSLRLILGVLCLLLILTINKKWMLSKQLIFKALLVGFVGYGISLGFQFSGTKLSTASNAALVTSASPVFILLFGVWILKERVTRNRVIALLLASLGVVAVVPNWRSIDLGTLLCSYQTSLPTWFSPRGKYVRFFRGVTIEHDRSGI